jgi:hypothetical protein
VAFTLLIVLAVFVWYGWIVPLQEKNRGREQADYNWARREAVLFVRDGRQPAEYRGFLIYDPYDAETGLEKRAYLSRQRRAEFSDAYNQRIRELLAERGIPQWSMKQHRVSNEDVIRAMTEDSFQEVTQFPHEVTPEMSYFDREGD